MWITVRVLETTDSHSGYEFSWSPYRLLPLSGKLFRYRGSIYILGSASYHHFHHFYNKGNFGVLFTIWDVLCGTNSDYFKYRHNMSNKGS